MGPVLHFRGWSERLWHLSALLVTEADKAPEPIRFSAAAPVRPYELARHRGYAIWRYDFSLPLMDAAQEVDYGIGDGRWRIRLPAGSSDIDIGQIRIAYASCNGTPEGEVWTDEAARNERWLHLATAHEHAPFHLLLHGGDQLYADRVWQDVAALAKWRRLSRPQRLAYPFTEAMNEAVSDYYFERYRRLWAQPSLAGLLAEVPSLMMWDDHDIFDGWGSHDPEWQACPVFQGIWEAARRHFALLQLGAAPGRLPDGFYDPHGALFGWSYRLGNIGIVAPDLRSERTRTQVMGEAGWRNFTRNLDRMAGCRHLLLLMSVPLVNIDWSPVERLLERLPGDPPHRIDLRDQWRSPAHRDEWLRMIRCLLDFSTRTGVRVTILSGEIHMAAFGTIEDGAVTIHQLISSGIAHPPLPAPLVFVLNRISRGASAIAPDLRLEIQPLPGLGYRFMRARNWLSLELLPDGGLNAVWHGADATSAPCRIPPITT